MWCEVFYKEHGNDGFTKGRKPSRGDWEEESEMRYEIGRRGYHLLTKLQCDKCNIGKIQGRDPDALPEKDMRILVTTIRATLDEFWSREPGTVKGTLMMVKRLGKVAGKKLGLETWLPPMGP